MLTFLRSVRGKLANSGGPARLLILGALTLLAVVPMIWVLNQIFMFIIARSYVDQLAIALDVNKHLATGILWGTFAVAALLARYAISFSRRWRLLGFAGLLVLLIGHSLILWHGTSAHFFARNGAPIKCYIVARDAVRYAEQPGIDPVSGRECRPVTAEIVERLNAYAGGARPGRLESAEPVFFEPRTGAAIVWYVTGANGQIELFDLMGFHPETGEELLPVSREVVQRWKTQNEERMRQEARRAPQRIDPETYSPFDPITGEPRVWYARNEQGELEFYDRSGFHQSTGERFEIVTRDVVDAWRKQSSERASQRCYVMTRDAVRYGERAGIDPGTGRQCRPVTEELLERLREYEKGNRPRRIDAANPSFFDLRTGEPIVWYRAGKDGTVELFDLMGFHPETGEELLPITREAVDLWKKQNEESKRRIPQRVDIGQYAPFDPLTGAPRVWFWRSDKGDYEFYDSAGFHPGTGEPLNAWTREAMKKRDQEILQREREEREKDELKRLEQQKRAEQEEQERRKREAERISQKCYVVTRDSVRYGDRPGIDPGTGRQCRPVTDELLERLREYEKGNRPKRIDAANPTFFDLRTGEPIMWYRANKDGTVELFDLMGFHPETGEELLPITREAVDLWKKQNEESKRRIPQRVDIGQYAPFDPLTGAPRVWFWRSDKGGYEFYDSAGFHPGTGEPLSVWTREEIKKREEEMLHREREDQQKRAEEQRKREDEQRKRAEEQRKRDEQQEQERRKRDAEAQAAKLCDQLAGNPNDPRRAAEGVSYEALRGHAKEAAEHCELAVKRFPSELRLQYQLARALQFVDRQKAFEAQKKLVELKYPAAFDNAGWLYISQDRNFAQAGKLFRMGAQLGDPDCMMSLAELIEKGYTAPSNANETTAALYARAAQLGHPRAREKLEVERGNAVRADQDRRHQEEVERQMFRFIGPMLRSIPMR